MIERISEIRLNFSGKELVIFIDGDDLLQEIDAIEARDRPRHKRWIRTGSDYRGLYAGDIIRNLDFLLGYRMRSWHIYGCASCGDLGCWPILVNVERMRQHVAWTSITNPSRQHEYRYDDIGGFFFDSNQYRTAWQTIAPAVLERAFATSRESINRTQTDIRHEPVNQADEKRRRNAQDIAFRSVRSFEHFAAALDLTRADIEPYTRELERLAFAEEHG